MRIGLFTDTYIPEINGVVSSVVLLQEELEKNGHDVFVITTKNSLFETEQDGNILRLPGIELKQLYGYVMTSPLHFAAMKKVEEMKLDIIHAHTEFGVGIFARLVAKKLNISLVSTYHTTYEDYTHYVNPIKSKSVDRLAKKAVANLSRLYGSTCVEMISPSEKTKEMLLGYGIKTPINIIPTGIDLKRFDRMNTSEQKRCEIREIYGIKEDECLILFVGRIAKEKSIDIPIEGFKKIKEEQIQARFLIVGGGPDEEELHQLVKKLDLNDYVFFAGKKTADEVPSYYHAADGFVSASLTETQGMTFIEALASELPVFARPDDILKDLVLEKETGFLFESSEEFADKVKYFMAMDQDEKQKMQSRTQEQVYPYDSRIFYQSVIEMYQRAVSTYKDSFEVVEIRTKKDAVEITLKNQAEEIKVLVSLDAYMSENIRNKGHVSRFLVKQLQKEEKEIKAYQNCIRKLATKDRTRKEIYDYLTQNTELDIAAMNRIVEILEDKGYIDDLRYTHNVVTSMKGMLQGEIKIFRSLKKKGITTEMIEEVMKHQKDDSSEQSSAIEVAIKLQSSIKEKSVRKKKQMIYQKLFNRGFSSEMIEHAIYHLNFMEEEDEELDVLRKIAARAKKRYASQNDGVKLRNMVFRYCSTQGFEMEDIYVVLSEMEWEDTQ